MTTVGQAAPAARHLRIGARRIPVLGPRITDPRLHVAAVVVGVQVIGQVALDFDLSILQILASLVTCAVIELVVVYRHRHAIVWPASALLTGNGVALVLRVPGTQHGDWWSAAGLWIFVATAALSMASKYLVRVDGRPLFNPSNFGLVACFIALGPVHAAPLDLWWADLGPALAITMTIIVIGGVTLAFRVHMVGVVVAFWSTLAVGAALLAATGHAMTARWHVGPIEGFDYWVLLVTSPEILVFLFFMITDPRTAPRGHVARVVYGGAVAALAMALASFQRTEYATKVVILDALLVVCMFRPLLERALPAAGGVGDRLRSWVPAARRPVRVVATLAVVAAVVTVAGGATTRRPGASAVRATARDCAGHRDRTVPRPAVATGPLPRVDNRPSVRVTGHFTDRQADVVARETVEDLVILGRARRDLDPALATAAATAPWLDHTRAAICRARDGRIEAATRYDLDELSVQILTRTASQRIPEIDVGLRGRVTLVTFDAGRPVDRRTVPYDELLTVDRVDGHWLIVERTPPLPPPP